MTLSKKQQQKVLEDYYAKIESGELIQLSTKSTSKLREKYWKLQNKECPVLNQEIAFEDSTADHMHRTQADIYGGPEWLGLIRGVLHKQANSWEGKCYNSYIKMGLHKFIGFSDALRNLANYIDNPTVPYGYIYYSEAPKTKRKKLGKRAYNKVMKHYKKVYPRRKKLPEKKRYLTKEWERYIKDTEAFLKKSQDIKKQRKIKRRQ